MNRVLVICPSRDRPKQLARFIHSVLESSERVDVMAYVDHDQQQLYGWTERLPERANVIFGPRIGPVAVANRIAKDAIGYEAFGVVPDDSVFTVAGWDKHVLTHLAGSVGVVAPAHSSLDVDMPFVSKKWLAALGWFAWPGLYHWGWPSIIAALAHATDSMVQSVPSEFWIEHPAHESANRDRYPADIVSLYDFFASHFERALRQVREAKR